MTPVAAGERLSAEERREQILQAAVAVFAEDGYAAASTEEIARRAGISQPYIFRLFGSKRELVLAAINRCFAETEALFRFAAEGRTGDEVLPAIGDAYMRMIQSESSRLRAQLQAYAACDDAEVRRVVARNFGHLVELVRRLSGSSIADISKFFATGMLLNVLVAMGQFSEPQRWAIELLEGCEKDLGEQGPSGGIGV